MLGTTDNIIISIHSNGVPGFMCLCIQDPDTLHIFAMPNPPNLFWTKLTFHALTEFQNLRAPPAGRKEKIPNTMLHLHPPKGSTCTPLGQICVSI